MVDYISMGQKMRARRRLMRLSQEELARRVQIAPSYYGNIERGIRIPSIDTLVAIANALEIGVDHFLADSLTAAFSRRSSEETKIVAHFLREKIAELEFDDLPSSQKRESFE